MKEAELTGIAKQAAADVDRLTALLAGAQTSDEDLSTRLAEAKTVESRAAVELETAKRACESLDLAALERKRDTLGCRHKQLNDGRLDLVGVRARLEEQTETLGGAGPATRTQAQQDLERPTEEPEVLA